MTDQDARDRTDQIITQLRALGRTEEAWELHRALTDRIGEALLLALREACETVLTMIEALDPETETLLERLRTDLDARLTPTHPTHTHT
jgi:hypothetical protein